MRTAFASWLLLTGLVSCGGEPSTTEQIDSGYKALASGADVEALSQFGRALARLDPTDSTFLTAKLGWIQALGHFDAQRAREELSSLPLSSKVSADDFVMVVCELIDAAEELASEDLDGARAVMAETFVVLDETATRFPSFEKGAALRTALERISLALGKPRAPYWCLGRLSSKGPAE